MRIVLVVGFVMISYPSSAQLIPADSDALGQLADRAHAMEADLVETYKTAFGATASRSFGKREGRTFTCLEHLIQTSLDVENALQFASTTVNVASRMRDEQDKSVATQAADAAVLGAMADLSNARKETTSEDVRCQDSAVVNNKAGSLLSFLGEVMDFLALVEERIRK